MKHLPLLAGGVGSAGPTIRTVDELLRTGTFVVWVL
jgi:hypothetical protein